MPQYRTGTATATTGSAAVTGSGTAWTGITTPAGVVPAFVIPISAGGDGVLYDIASIAADGSLTLATPYQGATIAGAAYAIQYAYTDDGIPEMSPNDIETAGIFTRAMRKIQSLLNALRTGVADLSGVTDAATARTNLSVYSAAETDTAIAAAVDDLQTGYLTKSVAGSANVALTASEQSNACIEFTGELTGNINVTVGDDKDGYRWTLINNTTGSFTLTFKTTSGTGAVIDQGAEAVVYHDGTNIVELLTVTAAGKALMDDATADAQLDTLGGTTVGKEVFTAADEAAARSAIDAPSTTEAEPTLLAEYVVTGSAVTSVQFAGLDINTHKSYRIEFDAKNATASNSVIRMFVNGDTTVGNYNERYVLGIVDTVATAFVNDADIGFMMASSGGKSEISLSLNAGYPVALVQEMQGYGGTFNTLVRSYSKTAMVVNITQLDFVASEANSIDVGSTFRIYRGDK